MGRGPVTKAAYSPSIRILADLLESRTGQALSDNRLWRIETSLKPVLQHNGLGSLDELAHAVGRNRTGPLAVQCVNALLNNETSFFRDGRLFQMIGRDLLPDLIQRAEETGRRRVLRIWCAGCSTGQEAYSVAMLFANTTDLWKDWRLQILATDVSDTAIERARSGLFSQMDVQRGLAINDLLRWMTPQDSQWRIDNRLREMIDFRVDNLLSPVGSGEEYDIIFCRNVLLYFPPDRKKQIFDRLARCSRPGSYLLLGAGETALEHTEHFAASSRFRGAYERMGTGCRA